MDNSTAAAEWPRDKMRLWAQVTTVQELLVLMRFVSGA